MGEHVFEVGDVVESRVEREAFDEGREGFVPIGKPGGILATRRFWKVIKKTAKVDGTGWYYIVRAIGFGDRSFDGSSLVLAPRGQRPTNLGAPSPNQPRSVYLANPYGFSTMQRKMLLPPIVSRLEDLGFDVWEPFARVDEAGIHPGEPGWLSKISAKCLADVAAADCVLAVVNGAPPDEGVAIEVGYAFALSKPVFYLRDDFRTCDDSTEFPLNLMFLGGAPIDLAATAFYRTVDDLSDRLRPLARFAAGRGRPSRLLPSARSVRPTFLRFALVPDHADHKVVVEANDDETKAWLLTREAFTHQELFGMIERFWGKYQHRLMTPPVLTSMAAEVHHAIAEWTVDHWGGTPVEVVVLPAR